MFDLNLAKVAMPQHAHPIVIIGAGGIVRDAHLPAYRKAGFEVMGIFDPIQDRAASLSAEFGISFVAGSLRDAIASAPSGAVFDIATPANQFEGVLRNLPEGCGVLMQKPMGESRAETHRILELCRAKKLKAAVNFQLRFAPAMRAARQLIAKGAIGQVHDMEVRATVFTPWNLWTFLEQIPRVEILYHSVHYLDLLRSFLGDPLGVYAKTLKHPKSPNLASARSSIILDYGDTIRANIETNHGHEYGLRHQEAYVKWEGTKGAIKTRLGLLMNYPKGVEDEFEVCILESGKSPEWTSIGIGGSWIPDAFIGSMAELMRFVEGSIDLLPHSVEDAYKTMALVDAAYESSDRGGLTISYD